MKKIFLLHLFFLSAFFSFAQNDISAVTSVKYLDNYSNLQTYWRNNPGINNDGAGDPVFFGGSGYHIADRGVNVNPEPAFSSITTLNPIPIGSIDTQHKPQAKTWTYAGKWWCAVPPGSGGTWIYRLDGTTWTQILRLSTGGSRTDCWVVGDLVHVLMYKGSGANAIATAQYDPATNAYKVWSLRPSPTSVSFPTGVESATLTVDGTGRMWVAADAVTDIRVWWSDSPYTTWSAAITVATGITSDDISAVTKLQGKIGVFWSNQTTGLFGFKTHVDGSSPTVWSADEIPASQSAIPGNPRMADDHMNLTLASDGTLYCVAKTSYNSSTLPALILLVRRPAGTWDNLYPVTLGVGSQAIVLLNEVVGKVKVVYTSVSNGGQILYKETPVSNISFSAAATLMGGPTANYNFSSSTHQTYNPDVAIIATNQGIPRQIVSVLASDAPGGDVTPPSVVSILRSSPTTQNTTATTVVFAVNFSEAVTGVDATDFTLTKGGTADGSISNVSGSGAAYTVTVNSITGTGSLRLDLNATGTGIVDGASNAITGGFITGETYNVSPADVTPPSVVSILRSSPTTQNTTATTVVFAVNFSETVNGVDATDFTLTKGGTANGSISNVAGSGAAYTVTVNSITGTGSLRLDLNVTGTGIVDGASNAITGGFTTGETYNVSPADVTPPSVVSILRSSPTTQNTTATTVVFAVNFSEAVNGVDTTDFITTVTAGALSRTIVSVAAINSEGKIYDVTIGSISGDGTLRLDVKNTGTNISDAAGNLLASGYSSGETYSISQVVPPQPSTSLTRGPYLQMASQSAVTLRWRSSIATDSKIEVGTSINSYPLSGHSETVTTEHEVHINGLTAGTKYFYRFGSSSQILQGGSDNYFLTAPLSNASGKIRIAAFGDCGNLNSVQANVLNSYLNYSSSSRAELMLLLGDNAYPDGTDAEYQTKFFEPYGKTVLKNHVLFPTPGNHDYHTTTKAARTAPYYKNFSVPTQGECGGVASGTKSFYSFDWGNIHFLSLDSYGEESDASRLYDTLGPQVKWVKRDLEANSSKWTIAFWHHPPFTKGSHDSDAGQDLIKIRENFIRILERYGVDLILCGHSHVYERSYLLKGYYGTESSFNPSVHTVTTSSGKYNGSSNSCPYVTGDGKYNHGTVYVVSGSSSRSGVYVNSSFPHNALPFATRDGGMFYFEVEDNRLDAKFINEDGAVYDQFTILKEVNKTHTVSVAGGEAVTLTASWIGEYDWSNGATTRSITVAPNSNIVYTVTDNRNCLSDVFSISVGAVTTSLRSTNEARTTDSEISSLQIFPTLVKKGTAVTIQLKTSDVVEAAIFDNSGRVIRTLNLSSGTSFIGTSNLSAGIYFISLKDRKNSKIKFIVTD